MGHGTALEGKLAKMHRVAGGAAALSHLAAWAAFLFLLLWPTFYSGTSTEAGPDGAQQVAPYSASFLEVNDRWTLIPLAVPLAITAAGLLAALTIKRRRTQLVLLWLAAAFLLALCGLGMFSIGMFYLPAVLALLAAAMILSVTRRRDARAVATVHHQ